MNLNLRRPATLLALLMLILMGTTPPPARAQGDGCFDNGFCISGRIREFWEQNGGLPVFGLPVGPQHSENIGGKVYQVQQFERNRLELHPENARPYDVLLGRLGAAAFNGDAWMTWPKAIPEESPRYFAETGHTIHTAFWPTWSNRCLRADPAAQFPCTRAESLALFGLPLTEAWTEKGSDGKSYLTQWFERARFEYHPENIGTPYDVLLGLLGSQPTKAIYPAHFSYDRSTYSDYTTKFASKTVGGLVYYIQNNGGAVNYWKEGDLLATPIITGNASYEIADGLIVYLNDHDHISIDIEPAKWELTF